LNLPHLRSFRQRAVMSQEQLAQKSGVARDTISKLETGQRRAYPFTVRKLAAGLEVEPRRLLGGVEYGEEEAAKETAERPGEAGERLLEELQRLKPERDKRIGF
jgi:transcriptional regulator with XRE-family HTH domain